MDTNSTGSTAPIPCYNFYGYDPKEGLTITGIVLFGIVTSIVLYQTLRYKKYYFLAVPLASLAEFIGYITRLPSGQDPCSMNIYIVSYLLILIAPTCLVMGNYALIGKIISRTGIEHPFFTPRRIRNTFLSVDLVLIFVQGAGGGLMASPGDNLLGQHIMLAAIVCALALFVFFLGVVIYVHSRVLKETLDGDWRTIFLALYITVGFVIMRNCYRVTEFSGGYHNSISTNEKLFYGFDTFTMLCFVTAWIIFHPSRVDFEGNSGAAKIVDPKSVA